MVGGSASLVRSIRVEVQRIDDGLRKKYHDDNRARGSFWRRLKAVAFDRRSDLRVCYIIINLLLFEILNKFSASAFSLYLVSNVIIRLNSRKSQGRFQTGFVKWKAEDPGFQQHQSRRNFRSCGIARNRPHIKWLLIINEKTTRPRIMEGWGSQVTFRNNADTSGTPREINLSSGLFWPADVESIRNGNRKVERGAFENARGRVTLWLRLASWGQSLMAKGRGKKTFIRLRGWKVYQVDGPVDEFTFCGEMHARVSQCVTEYSKHEEQIA